MGFLKDMLIGTSGKAQKKNQANAAMLMKMVGTQYSYGLDALLKGLTGIDVGFDQAQGILAKQGTAATNAILASKAQTDAANKAGLVASGFSSSSIGANLANQSQAMTAQSLTALSESLGTQQAGLLTQKATVKNAAYQSLAQYAMGKVGAMSGVVPQFTGSQGALAGLFGGFGQSLGQSFGKAAGSGLGNLFGGKKKDGEKT